MGSGESAAKVQEREEKHKQEIADVKRGAAQQEKAREDRREREAKERTEKDQQHQREMADLVLKSSQAISEAEKEKIEAMMAMQRESNDKSMNMLQAQFRQSEEQAKSHREEQERQLVFMERQAKEQSERFIAAQEQHKFAMENYKGENAAMIDKFTSQIADMTAALEEAEAEPFDPKDPDRMMRKQDETFEKFCKMAGDYLQDVPKLQRASIAVLGQSGVGKSTLINAFADREVAETDVVECTQIISKAYSTDDYDFYDVPGQTNERADFYNIDNLHKIKSLHLILVVYTDRITTCTKSAKLMKSIQLPVFIVRQKCDFLANQEQAQKAFDKEKEVKDKLGLEVFPLFYLGDLSDADKKAKKCRMQGVDLLMKQAQADLRNLSE